MGRPIFRSIDEVLSAGLLAKPCPLPSSDRVLRSTRLEDKLYADLRQGDEQLDSIEAESLKKLPTFNALSRDVYQSFYSLSVRRNEKENLSDLARQFNSPILEDMMNGEDYPTIKSICEGRQLPAYEAAVEFVENISANLDSLLEKAGGNKGALNTLENARRHEERLKKKLESLMERREQQNPDPDLDRRIIEKAGKVSGKARQIEAIEGQIRDNMMKNGDAIAAAISQASKSAKEKAQETALTMAAWGQGEDDTSPERLAHNREALNRVRQSKILQEVTRLLGRFKELAAKARKNSYAYGRGEKYTLELGNNISRALTSEFAALALPATIPLFLRKYQSRGLQQYKRREAVYKGSGDIIMCVDESDSAVEEAPWGKAVALTLLDAAMAGGRKFALIHFSSTGKFQTDLFIPGQYGAADMIAAAETFLGGCTDYETPLKEALRLIEREAFSNADIVFATDGICALPAAFRQELKAQQAAHGFKITGVLLDMASPGMAFSLEPFCDEVYRTSELAQEKIVEALISKQV